MLDMDDKCVFLAIHLSAAFVLGPKDIPGTLPKIVLISFRVSAYYFILVIAIYT